jgi:hypothetical protein
MQNQMWPFFQHPLVSTKSWQQKVKLKIAHFRLRDVDGELLALITENIPTGANVTK